MDFNRVVAIFQPFTFSRTFLLFDDFVRVLSIADEVILSPIMGSREVNTYNIFSEDLASKINNCKVFETIDLISDYVKKNIRSGDIVLTLGCGDIYK